MTARAQPQTANAEMATPSVPSVGDELSVGGELSAADELSAEDAKLVTLARGALARAGAAQGAAVRDDDGRTYAAASVSLPSLTLTALQAAVVLAASSAATGLEAAVLVGGGAVDESSLALARELGAPMVIVTDAAGALLERRPL